MQPAEIVMLEGGGPRLALRVRRPEGRPRGALLFVHGATLASEFYDVPLAGYSWMAAAAAAGRMAFAVDLRGYGLSERPACFERPASEAPPYARAQCVLADIDRAVEAARSASGLEKIDLVGGSWGSVTSSLYAAGPGREKLRRLVLYAPLYAERNPPWLEICGAPADPDRLNPDLGAYRWVAPADLRARWDEEIPYADKSRLRPEAVFQALIGAALAADPASARRDPPAFRVPNGTLVDLHSVFSGRPLYDPVDITLPTLLLRGDADPTSTHDDTARLLAKLGSNVKRQETIPGATHFAIAERAAPRIFRAAEAFLSS
ncbi:MAG: alpha/beta fold hydrolase [Rhodospirillales bacterium]